MGKTKTKLKLKKYSEKAEARHRAENRCVCPSSAPSLPNLGGLGSPAPVHLVLAQQLDLLDQDVVYGEPSDEHTGPLGLVLERDEACRHLAGLAGWVGWLAR